MKDNLAKVIALAILLIMGVGLIIRSNTDRGETENETQVGPQGPPGEPGEAGYPESWTFIYTDPLNIEHTYTCTDPDLDRDYDCEEI